MDIQNKSNIYTTNNALPPSYAEATSAQPSIPNTYNPECNQSYPYIVGPSPSAPFPHPSNSYLTSPPVQSTYPQDHPTTFITYHRSLRRPNIENCGCQKCIRFIWMLCVLIVAGIVAVIIIKILRNN